MSMAGGGPAHLPRTLPSLPANVLQGSPSLHLQTSTEHLLGALPCAKAEVGAKTNQM